MADQKPIGIRELILKVKEELLSERDDTQPLFLIGQIELEISFTVERNAQGGIDFQVVQGGVEKTWSQVQTVKVRLDPILSREELEQDLTPTQRRKVKDALQRKDSKFD